MPTVSEHIADVLVRHGVTHVFGVQGGMAIHLFDAVGKRPELTFVPMHGEAGAAYAGKAFAQASGGLGVCMVTAGIGSVAALPGCLSAWQDSVPVLFLSGFEKMRRACAVHQVRQMGTQDADIIPMVRPVTKFATIYERPLLGVVENAIYAATSKRKGPVWVAVPLDVQTMTLS